MTDIINEEVFISGLVGSKICHDLINSISAIGNGIELLFNVEKTQQQNIMENQLCKNSLKLIMNSSEIASARIQLYRVAFGNSRIDNTCSAESAFSLITRLENAMGDHAPKFEGTTNIDIIERDYIKIFLNLVMSGFECLVRGGDIKGDIQMKSSSVTLKIIFTSEKMITYAPGMNILTNKQHSPDDILSMQPRDIGYFICRTLVNKRGGKMSVANSNNKVSITVKLPV